MTRTMTGLFFLFSLTVAGISTAQEPTSLYLEIAKADAELFDAFNACDLEKMGDLFAKDLEFYHDIAGFSDYPETMEGMKANCARNLDLRRELVKDSLKVYPVDDDGAIQVARHTFCHLEGDDNVCGTFDLVQVWKRHDGDWKLARVISYGH